ncbi:hypothetical protein [Gynuella sunshinyii]|uniref:Flagellar hook-length control protein FliK n=1 Tax=Gynuella sunshinyii YC6258 TaxID=1445510 RepID=A0A0C5VQ72_9GAMM|nr:hypothetical protein [Gynuella sunshinyii]AJQ96727.1 hypothetical Protein YC6258_04695 [Gynuella sunshinyii YC6258]
MANISKEPIRLSPSSQTGSISSQTEHPPAPARAQPQPPPTNKLIEAVVIRSEPFVDLQKGNGEQYLLELKTPQGTLFVKYHRALEQGTVLLLEPDDQHSFRTADLSQEPLRLKQLILAAQQFNNESLPKAKFIEGLSTRIVSQLQNTAFESIPTRIQNALIAVLVRHAQIGDSNAETLRQWVGQIQKPALPIIEPSRLQTTLSPLGNPHSEHNHQQNFARAAEVVRQIQELSQPVKSNSQWQSLIRILSVGLDHPAPSPQSAVPSFQQHGAQVAVPPTTGSAPPIATDWPTKLQSLFTQLQPYIEKPEKMDPATSQQTTTNLSSTATTTSPPQSQENSAAIRQRFIALLTKASKTSTVAETGANSATPDFTHKMAEKSEMPQVVERIARKTENLPLSLLLMELERSLNQELRQRPDSIANRLKTEAQRILGSTGLYTPESLKKQAHGALRPGSQSNTQALEAVLNESRSALAKIQSQQMNNLQFQFEPEYHRAHFQQFEIPINLPGVMTHAFAEIWHPLDNTEDSAEQNNTRQQRKWHLRLHMEFKPLPPHCVELFFSLKNEHQIQQLGLVFWSEDPFSLTLFNQYQDVLQSVLQSKGIDVERVESKRGLPVREHISKQQHSQSMVDFKV